MNQTESTTAIHKNDLSTYLGNWRMVMNAVSQTKPAIPLPRVFESLSNNTHDFSVILGHLHDRLTVLERTQPTPDEFDYLAYSEARVFLKASYVFFRIVLDDISGILEYFYKKNEPAAKVKSSFNTLLKRVDKGLPPDLSALLQPAAPWFSEMKTRRDNLVHRYDSFLIASGPSQDGRQVVRHISTKARAKGFWSTHEDVRQYFGYLLSHYQQFIDKMLEHLDVKLQRWYNFRPHRDATILQGYTALPLWWASTYGGYTHTDLRVTVDGIQVS